MESRYLKPILKSGRSTIGIWRSIALGIKGPVHFLEKESRMNSDIYINQVLEELGLLFYKQYIRKKGPIIWIDDGAGHYTSKISGAYCPRVGLIHLDWPTQSPHLNPIGNLWRIIKIRDCIKCHRIQSLKSMKGVIKEEWEKLMEEDFCAYIESSPKQCKLVILAQGGSITYWSIYHVC